MSNAYSGSKSINSGKWYFTLNNMARMVCFGQKIILKTDGWVARDFIWLQDVYGVVEKSLNLAVNTLLSLSSEET